MEIREVCPGKTSTPATKRQINRDAKLVAQLTNQPTLHSWHEVTTVLNLFYSLSWPNRREKQGRSIHIEGPGADTRKGPLLTFFLECIVFQKQRCAYITLY
jgi:hypothetical protein